MFNPLFLCVYFDKIPLGVPEKRKLFGEEEKGMECLLRISKKFIQTRNFFRRIVGATIGCLIFISNFISSSLLLLL